MDFIVSKEKKTFEDNYMIAECYNILGYRNKAYPYIDLCMKKFNILEDKEDKIKVYLLYSSICIGINRMDKALDSIDRSIKLDNKRANLYMVKADILKLLKRDRESYNFYNIALKKYDEGLPINCDIEYVYLGVATVCSSLNKLDEIITNLDNFIEIIGGNEFILDIQYELSSGMIIDGLRFSMDMILDVYHMYIATYMDFKKYNYARKYLEYALTILPTDMENKFLEGRVIQAEIMEKESSELRKKYEQIINSNLTNYIVNVDSVSNLFSGGSINMGDMNFNADVKAGVINNGSNSIVNYYNSEEDEKNNIDNFVNLINKQMDNLQLNMEEKIELQEQISKLEESNSSNNSNGKSKEILKSIRNMFEGITGSIIATEILKYVGQILIK
ncbi:hypothetical protein KTC96_18955 [Clostridium estertheticum]|uniref:tetratricopeptide repeat protein n=1 Tax=Clostridium estertheticum TaxID=238834 RepID=UPI001C7E1ABC|nr:hypothetical protein [Clostridium estertheticum]MBX4258544.1 hypothetical protein [Clostridium estertheticum]WLC69977.1 hypothetical protein KTC96_18955 [Clostridium estertheticum]